MSGKGPQIFTCVSCKKQFNFDDTGEIDKKCYCFDCFKKFLKSIHPENRYTFIAGDDWTSSQKKELRRIAESYGKPNKYGELEWVPVIKGVNDDIDY